MPIYCGAYGRNLRSLANVEIYDSIKYSIPQDWALVRMPQIFISIVVISVRNEISSNVSLLHVALNVEKNPRLS